MKYSIVSINHVIYFFYFNILNIPRRTVFCRKIEFSALNKFSRINLAVFRENCKILATLILRPLPFPRSSSSSRSSSTKRKSPQNRCCIILSRFTIIFGFPSIPARIITRAGAFFSPHGKIIQGDRKTRRSFEYRLTLFYKKCIR